MRKRKTRRQKQDEFKRRYDAIRSLMSTFTMGTIAVVAAVVLIPASPKAEIIKAVSLREEVVYQVNVTDEDNALDLSSLFIVLENQLEYYEMPIELGENNGYFSNLNTETQYRLSVYGDKGFGQERLDTTFITTSQKEGATILSVEEAVESNDYLVYLSVFDPDSSYTSIDLYYGYQSEPDTPITYTQVPINSDIIELNNLYFSNQLHIYIEGTDSNGTTILDEIWVQEPFTLHMYAHIKYINNNSVAFHIYEGYSIENIQYDVLIYQNGKVLQELIPEKLESLYSGTELVIPDLRSDTTYEFEIIAHYKNPQTLRDETQSIYTQELTTTKDYSYSYVVTDLGNNQLEYVITLEDQNNIFDHTYIELSDYGGEYPQYYTGNLYMLEEIDNKKIVTFIVDTTDISYYLIEVYLQNATNSDIKQIIEIRSNK